MDAINMEAASKVQTQREKNAEALKKRLLRYANFHNNPVDETLSTFHDLYSYFIAIGDYTISKPEGEQVTESQLELILVKVIPELAKNKCVTCDAIIAKLMEKYDINT